MMKVLVTGNMGYIGPVLIKELRHLYPRAELVGFDTGYFAHCLTNASMFPECHLDRQLFGDIRRFPFDVLDDVDVVIHLAAISNDPMGNLYEVVTEAINDQASKLLASQAKARGVARFVFASSCSIYGHAEGDARREEDPLNPLTAYARSKVAMEKALEGLADERFQVTALRFATACGMSPRLRLDLVLNDFVASAISSGEITVLSDGSPWRPLIHVKDMSRAIAWGISREKENGGNFLAVNVGSRKWNYQVKDLACAVADIIPGTRVSINADAQPDRRSYCVDFGVFSSMAPDYQPLMTLESTILDLKGSLEKMRFSDVEFRQSNYMRLKVLESHVREGYLNKDLEWAIA